MPREIDPDQLVQRLERVAAAFPGREASRITTCMNVLRTLKARFQATGNLVGDDVHQLALAMQDGLFAAEAFEELVAVNPVPMAREKLQSALSGPFLVPPAPKNDEGRDLLWELFLAARLRAGRFEPSIEEPDVGTTACGVRLGAAAKRIRSQSDQTFRKRIRKATGQVAGAVQQNRVEVGFVALDLSFALRQHPQVGRPWNLASRRDAANVRSAIGMELAKIGKSVFEVVDGCPQGRHVVGVTIMVMPLVRDANTRRLGLVRYFVTIAFDQGGRSAVGVRALKEVAGHCLGDQ